MVFTAIGVSAYIRISSYLISRCTPFTIYDYGRLKYYKKVWQHGKRTRFG